MSQGDFQKIDRDQAAPPGPAALLLCGYSLEESEMLSSLLQTIGLAAHRMILCTEQMLAQRLGEALSTDRGGVPAAADKLPRVLVLSGMTGAQVHTLLRQYSTAQLPRPIFATVTAVNLHFTVRDLLVELLREHSAMRAGK